MDLEEERATLAADLRRVDDYLGGLVGDARTELRELTVPLLRHTRVFVGERLLPTRPLLIHFGRHQSGRVFLISGKPAEFNRMLEAEGLRVESGEAALELARLFLECTRPQDERFKVVESLDELPWMPGEAPEQIAAARQEVAPLLKTPAARSESGSWVIELSVVHDRGLEDVTVRVSATGAIAMSARTAIERLPLTYVGG